MPTVYLETFIQAPIERCFDLSRSIDLHRSGLAHTNEEAVAGVTSGLIGLNQTVTWRATHFGIRQHLTVVIDRFDRPYCFSDRMVKGAFKSFRHDHLFEVSGDGCLMRDVFEFESPLGVLGRIADKVFLERYMTRLLITRNAAIKEAAETESWREVLGGTDKSDFGR